MNVNRHGLVGRGHGEAPSRGLTPCANDAHGVRQHLTTRSGAQGDTPVPVAHGGYRVCPDLCVRPPLVDRVPAASSCPESFVQHSCRPAYRTRPLRAAAAANRCADARIVHSLVRARLWAHARRSGLGSLVWSRDRHLQHRSGVEMLELNGCTGCNKHVYLPHDKSKHCPRPGCGANRYSPTGIPYEVQRAFLKYHLRRVGR